MDEVRVEEAKETPKRKRRVTVRLAERRHQAVIVEKDGEYRCVPANELDGDKLAPDVWDAGVSFGEKWEDMEFGVSGEDIADVWRRMGIWTLDELRDRRNEAYTAVCGLARAALIEDLKRRLQ